MTEWREMMKHAVHMILASTLVASVVSAPAFAQGFAATQNGKEISSSRTQLNTTLQQPAVSSTTLIPTFEIGGSGLAEATSGEGLRINPKSSTSYAAGMLAEFGRRTFVFQSGLLYMNAGLQLNTQYVNPYDGSIQNSDTTGALQYIAIPVVGKARVRIGDGVRLGFRAGVMPAMVVGLQGNSNYTLSDSAGNVIRREQRATNDTRGLRAVNAIAVVGAGPEIRVARNQNIRIEGNYERFLMPIEQDGDDRLVIHSFNAMLSYGIGF